MSTDEQIQADADEARAEAKTNFALAVQRAIALASDQPDYTLNFSVSRYPIRVTDLAQARIGFALVQVSAEAKLAFLIEQIAEITNGFPHAQIEDVSSEPMVRLSYPLINPDVFWDTGFQVRYCLLTRMIGDSGERSILVLDRFAPDLALK